MNQSWYIIANPTAGNGTVAKQLPYIKTLFKEANLDFELMETTVKGQATDLVKTGLEKGFRNIIAVGGDGTNNEVVNGIMKQEIVSPKDIVYTLLPLGTGNDWIKEHQIPKDFKAWITMLQAGKRTWQDIGWCSCFKDGTRLEHYFANVAGMSYDAFVVDEMNKLKRPITNRIAYLLYGLYYVFKYKLPKARVYFNDQIIEDYFYLINAGICRFSGGGMQFVPHAIPNDGQLALTLAGRFSKIGVLLNSHRFYNGKIAGHSKVNVYKTQKVKIEAINQSILVEVDGEVLGQTPVEFKVLPRALQIIIP